MAIGEIISIGNKDGYFIYKEDLIGKWVEFNPTDVKHFGSGWRKGPFRATQDIYSKGFYMLKGELLHFILIRVRIVKE